MSNQEKTHFRKVFTNQHYLAAVDLESPLTVTIKSVVTEKDKTKRTKETHNTAYFVEGEIRRGEKLKPMILNTTNCKVLKTLTGSGFIEDWVNLPITIYVDDKVRFGRDTVSGLRISPTRPVIEKKPLTPDMQSDWGRAKTALKQYGNLERVLVTRCMTQEHVNQIKAEVSNGNA